MTATETEDALRTIEEVARRLRLSRASVYRRVAAGDLPAYRLGPSDTGPLRIRASDVERLLYPVSERKEGVA